MSRKMKQCLAVMLSLVTVLSCTFAAMAETMPAEEADASEIYEAVAAEATEEAATAEKEAEVEAAEEAAEELLGAGTLTDPFRLHVTGGDLKIKLGLSDSGGECKNPISIKYAVSDTGVFSDYSEYKVYSNLGYESESGYVEVKAGQWISFIAAEHNATFSGNGYAYVIRATGEAGKLSVDGKLAYLLDNTGKATAVDSAFYELFYGCDKLEDASGLILLDDTAVECYDGMFDGCESLTEAPVLPATELAESCYASMFAFCTALTEAPVLPAIELADHCYESMFLGCTSLTNAPALPATTLAEACYYYMFGECAALTKAPALPATKLAAGCYAHMFEECISLEKAPALPATELVPEDEEKEIPACYESMFSGCEKLKKAPALPATTLAEGCYANMFVGCKSLTEAPVLPATTLVKDCYYDMFCGCSSLNKISVAFTDWTDGYGPTVDWLEDVSNTGDFYMPKGLAIPEERDRDSYSIPADWTIHQTDAFLISYCGQGVVFSGVGGTAETTAAKKGDTVAFVVNPDKESVRIKKVTWSDGARLEEIQPVSGVYFFEMPAASVTVMVETETLSNSIEYSGTGVTFQSTDGGEAPKTAKAGDFVVFQVKADSKDIEVSVTEKSTGAAVEVIAMASMESVAYRFTMPDADVVVKATVNKKPDPTPSSDDDDDEPLFTGTWNNAVNGGKWSQDANGVWHYSSSQVFRATWGYIVNPYAHEGQNTADWFWFDANGNMLTGWQLINGKWYYLNPTKDGTLGACLIGPARTPDGYEVDASGAWTGR